MSTYLSTPEATVKWLLQYVKDNGFNDHEIEAVSDLHLHIEQLDEENTLLSGKLGAARRERDHAETTLALLLVSVKHRHGDLWEA